MDSLKVKVTKRVILTNRIELGAICYVPDWHHVELLQARLDLLGSVHLQVVHKNCERRLLKLESKFVQVSSKVFGVDCSRVNRHTTDSFLLSHRGNHGAIARPHILLVDGKVSVAEAIVSLQ
jgi:hypothetical protein